MLLGLGSTFFRVTQLAVSLIHVQARLTHFVVDAHAFFQQFFKLEAQFFQRRFALLQVQRELLTLFCQALSLLLQALQRLAG
ncbi:hypothetical protein D3C81_727700 [compost metagenome]